MLAHQNSPKHPAKTPVVRAAGLGEENPGQVKSSIVPLQPPTPPLRGKPKLLCTLGLTLGCENVASNKNTHLKDNGKQIWRFDSILPEV